MNAAWIPFWATVIVAIIGATPVVMSLRAQWRKDRIDMMAHLSDRVDVLELDREDDRAHINNLERHIDELRAIIMAEKPDRELPPRPVRKVRVV